MAVEKFNEQAAIRWYNEIMNAVGYEHRTIGEPLRTWRNETARMKRFLKRNRPFIEGVVCVAGHCSKYDNSRDRKDVI